MDREIMTYVYYNFVHDFLWELTPASWGFSFNVKKIEHFKELISYEIRGEIDKDSILLGKL